MNRESGSFSSHRLQVAWVMAISLGLVALVRPISRIVTSQWGIDLPPIVVILTTVVISVVWILIAGLRDGHSPVATLIVAGLVYAVSATLLSAVLSPLLDGELARPLAHPVMIPMVLANNLVWGAVTGAIALAVRRIRRASRARGR